MDIFNFAAINSTLVTTSKPLQFGQLAVLQISALVPSTILMAIAGIVLFMIFLKTYYETVSSLVNVIPKITAAFYSLAAWILSLSLVYTAYWISHLVIDGSSELKSYLFVSNFYIQLMRWSFVLGSSLMTLGPFLLLPPLAKFDKKGDSKDEDDIYADDIDDFNEGRNRHGTLNKLTRNLSLLGFILVACFHLFLSYCWILMLTYLPQFQLSFIQSLSAAICYLLVGLFFLNCGWYAIVKKERKHDALAYIKDRNEASILRRIRASFRYSRKGSECFHGIFGQCPSCTFGNILNTKTYLVVFSIAFTLMFLIGLGEQIFFWNFDLSILSERNSIGSTTGIITIAYGLVAFIVFIVACSFTFNQAYRVSRTPTKAGDVESPFMKKTIDDDKPADGKNDNKQLDEIKQNDVKGPEAAIFNKESIALSIMDEHENDPNQNRSLADSTQTLGKTQGPPQLREKIQSNGIPGEKGGNRKTAFMPTPSVTLGLEPAGLQEARMSLINSDGKFAPKSDSTSETPNGGVVVPDFDMPTFDSVNRAVSGNRGASSDRDSFSENFKSIPVEASGQSTRADSLNGSNAGVAGDVAFPRISAAIPPPTFSPHLSMISQQDQPPQFNETPESKNQVTPPQSRHFNTMVNASRQRSTTLPKSTDFASPVTSIAHHFASSPTMPSIQASVSNRFVSITPPPVNPGVSAFPPNDDSSDPSPSPLQQSNEEEESTLNHADIINIIKWMESTEKILIPKDFVKITKEEAEDIYEELYPFFSEFGHALLTHISCWMLSRIGRPLEAEEHLILSSTPESFTPQLAGLYADTRAVSTFKRLFSEMYSEINPEILSFDQEINGPEDVFLIMMCLHVMMTNS